VLLHKNSIISKHHSKALFADVHMPESPGRYPTMLFLHGTRGFKDWGAWHGMAELLNQQGIGVVLLNFSHNGTSPENPAEFTDLDAYAANTISLEVQEAQVALDWILDKAEELHIDATQITICGHSRGGGVALIAGLKSSIVSKVIALAPVANFLDIYKQQSMDAWKKQGFITSVNQRTGQEMRLNYTFVRDILDHKQELDPCAAAALLEKPLMLLHGANDESVPMEASEKIYNECLHALFVPIANTGHTFGVTHPWEESKLPAPFLEVVENIQEFVLD
jgi:fermentation-respiration switch protein FrsA (DUF1100 family)